MNNKDIYNEIFLRDKDFVLKKIEDLFLIELVEFIEYASLQGFVKHLGNNSKWFGMGPNKHTRLTTKQLYKRYLNHKKATLC